MGFNLSPLVEVGGATSISTILLVDKEVQSFPLYIFLYQPPEERHNKNYNWEFQLENPKVVKILFCLFSLPRRHCQDSNPIICVHQRSGEQVSGTVFAILHREKANKVFGKLFRVTAPKWLLHLLPGSHSRDFTSYIFLHRHCTTTSIEVLPRLVWLIQRITVHRLPPVIAPPLGTFPLYCGFICSSFLICPVYESCLH
jgi:hypothetical protein